MRHHAACQLSLPGFEVEENLPSGESPAPLLEIPAELRMVVKDWRLPAG